MPKLIRSGRVPAQSLKIGNVITAALRLYAAHHKRYLLLSFTATAWSFLPSLIVGMAIGIYAISPPFSPNVLGLLVLVLAWVGFSLYCSANVLAVSAAIARLVYGELTMRPESVASACRHTEGRMWRFLWVGFLISCLFLGAIIVPLSLLFLASIALPNLLSPRILGVGLRQAPNPQAISTGVFFGLSLTLLIVLFVLVGLLWLAVRLSITDLPLAVERNVTVVSTINRSWELTEKHALRIMAVLSLAALVTLPIGVVSQVIVSIIQGLLPFQSKSTTNVTYNVTVFLVAYGFGLLTNVIIIPFWQAVKAVLYYDLRCRREGLGLRITGS
jgi:membrane-anchored glycerophosphoryl diester phosphodiesterase (GDPDase)